MHRTIFLTILTLTLGIPPVHSQLILEPIPLHTDCSGWLKHNYEGVVDGNYYVGINLSSIEGEALGFYSDNEPFLGMLAGSGDPLEIVGSRFWQGYYIIPVPGGITLYFHPDRVTYVVIANNGIPYGAPLSVQELGDFHPPGNDILFRYYSFPYINPTPESLNILKSTNGAGTGGTGGGPGNPPDFEDFDFEALLSMLEWLGELLGHQSTQLELIMALLDNGITSQKAAQSEQNMFSQYGIGLISFLSGMTLAALFLFGLKLR